MMQQAYSTHSVMHVSADPGKALIPILDMHSASKVVGEVDLHHQA